MGNSMSKDKKRTNSKNTKHKDAVKRKAQAAMAVGQVGLDLGDDLLSVGVVFEHLGISHLGYFGIMKINELCSKYVGVDLAIFQQQHIRPCINPSCSMFDVKELPRWYNPLIATNSSTCLEALDSSAPVIYHYSFDPDFIHQPNVSSRDRQRAFCDPRVKVLTRHPDHKKLIETEFGIKVIDQIVEDFDMWKIIRIIAEGRKTWNLKSKLQHG